MYPEGRLPLGAAGPVEFAAVVASQGGQWELLRPGWRERGLEILRTVRRERVKSLDEALSKSVRLSDLANRPIALLIGGIPAIRRFLEAGEVIENLLVVSLRRLRINIIIEILQGPPPSGA